MKNRNNNASHRRQFIKNSAFSLFGISTMDFGSVIKMNRGQEPAFANEPLYYRYPAIHDTDTYGVVSAAHSNLGKVKELVTKRPELAGASWNWGFGDFETAIGAASHTGRRDIAEFLMSYGARPDIFTFAMMGMLNSLQEIIETVPSIQSHRGPHSITLLKHAQNRLSNKDITPEDKVKVQKVISYLESLGNADVRTPNLPLTENDKKIFLGDYRFGDNPTEIFTVGPYSLDPNYIRLTRAGLPSRVLFKIDENTFSPTGASSVNIVFTIKENKAVSLTIHEREPLVTALRV
jgi:hypothetical protein